MFGYASLVGLYEPAAVPGRLGGFRRHWGAAMNNWEGGDEVKHFLDRETGERPRIRVAYLDIEPSEGAIVNGLAIPVDAARLAALDAREINYERVDISGAFEPEVERVFAYMGTPAARERCKAGIADSDCFVSREYLEWVRQSFAALGDDALGEFERTTEPPLFPERDLRMIPDRRAGG